MEKTDHDFLRECAALFRAGDPERARRLDGIADGVPSGKPPFMDADGLHVTVVVPSAAKGVNGAPVPEAKETVIPAEALRGAALSRSTCLATDTAPVMHLLHGRGEVLRALADAGVEVFS